MGSIIKKYWKWNEKLNSTEFKLRDDILVKLSEGLIIPDPEEEYAYNVVSGNPWHLRTNDKNKIIFISFRETFFTINGNDNIWSLNYHEFDNLMSTILNPTEETDKGDKICVIFRDFFVAVVVLTAACNNT